MSVRHALAASLVGMMLLLAGCSGGEPASESAPAGGNVGAPAQSDQSRMQAGAPAAPAEVPAQAPDPSVDQKLIRSASLTLAVDDLRGAASRVKTTAAGIGGQVVSEHLDTTPYSPDRGLPPSQYGTITVQVPADRLDEAVDAFSKLGTVTQQSSSSQDVTAAYADTESRIASKKASIERVRALMTQAENISQVVELETQLAQREADLEALQAQLGSMENRIAMSPVTINLTTSPVAEPVVDENPFLAGLREGWLAFTKALGVGAMLLGTMIPFALAAGLVLIPLRWWAKHRKPGKAPAGQDSD